MGIWRFGMIDCQMKTAHLASLGAREIPRAQFMRELEARIEAASARLEKEAGA